MSENIREIALDSLMEIFENDRFCHIIIGNVLEKYQYLDKKDRAFYSRLVQGTCENIIYIDYVIDKFSKVKVKKMKPFIRNNMRLAVYQIIFMQSVPDSAACNEAVKLAIKRGFMGLKGFVNGVLRNVAREYTSVNIPDDDNPKHLSLRYSVPLWIVDMWKEQYGINATKAMLSAVNGSRKITVRACVNPNSDCEEEISDIKKSLENDGVNVEKASYVKEALKLSNVDHISKLEAFKNGKIYVQDVSSMLVVHIANIKKEDFVLDMCASPGGKTLHAASYMDGTGKIVSRDISFEKTDKIRNNIERCGYSNIVVEEFDATKLDATMVEQCDVVLCDVPCSGLGVIGRKIDIRYKTKREDIDELVKIQRDILENAIKYVKPGKCLIFSTCTVNDYENIENVKWIEENSNLELESIDEFIPDELKSETTSKGYMTLMPGINDTDGFFIARFVRKK